ncbi:siderophore ABC transporter substrate-binding protein [Cohaesibacter haloalkalitolerans]|uniref:siderophore ABC transporter substrate-binding protein n=1 Tax=Cohaesibacter haloalkalitolerans TaxID=1162980 RepID=UPI001FE0F73A|nr:siderophore ABC transporter substrate-binding protein [Cohaesibacter haloalkalitolerans]
MTARLSRLAMTCAAMLAFAATQVSAAEITVDTAREPVTFAAQPEKVVVMDIAALDTMDALGVTPVGVPNKLYVQYLNHLEGKAEPIGSLFEPNFEAINALQPDLAVIGGRSAKQYEALEKVAPTIDMTISGADMVGQAKKRLESYGALFNKRDKAAELEMAFDAKLAEAKAAVKGKGNALIILANGPKISTYGASGRFGWIHDAVGLPEAISTIEDATHGEAVSFEFIRDVNPDWLLVIDRSAAIGASGDAASTTLDNALVHETKAWKAGQVVYLDAANIYIASGGIQSMTHTINEIIKAFGGANPS